MSYEKVRSTTVIAVKKDGHVAMAGDGQVTMGNTVMKGNAHCNCSDIQIFLAYHFYCFKNVISVKHFVFLV